MKKSTVKSGEISKLLVFPQTLHRVRARVEKATPNPKPPGRDNIFSKSRDTREDRGERQIKTSRNAQTFPHTR
jgi:hypothetical protein